MKRRGEKMAKKKAHCRIFVRGNVMPKDEPFHEMMAIVNKPSTPPSATAWFPAPYEMALGRTDG